MNFFKNLILGIALSSAVRGYFYPHACQNTSRVDGGCWACNSRIGFTNDGFGNCLNTDAQDCLGWDEYGYCMVCPTGLVPWGSACKYAPLGTCLSYTPSGNCYYCAEGFYPNGTNCAPINANPVPNCRFYASETVCLYCAAGFYVSASGCLPLPVNCALVSGIQCASCGPGYVLVNSAGTISNGRTTSKEISNSAYFGSVNALNFVCRPFSIANCVEYSNATYCGVCSSGYYTNTDGSCVLVGTIINQCQNYTYPGICSECVIGFYISGGQCITNPAVIPNCVAYSTPSNCSRCDPGYYVNDATTCSIASITIPNCVVYASTNTCQYCLTGFYANANGGCTAITQSISNCLSYNITGCALCSQGYYVNSGFTCSTVTITVANCAWYSSNGACAYCANGSYLKEKVCEITSVENCDIVSTAATCQYCYNGYYPDVNGTSCVEITTSITHCMYYATANTCALCDENYILNQSSTACSIYAIANCQRFSNETQCVYCTVGYYYNAEINNCNATSTVANCVRYNDDATCIWCANNYYLSANACIQIDSDQLINDCAVYTAPGVCLWCQTNFYPADGGSACFTVLLSERVSNCNFYNTDGFNCVECNGNFYLDTSTNRTCIPVYQVISNCQSYYYDYSCARCLGNTTYENSTSNCVAATYVAECWEHYDVLNGSGCWLCNHGYYPNTTLQCLPISDAGIVEDCLFYSGFSYCALCNAGFYNSGGTCYQVEVTITGCLYYNSTDSCAYCQSGYVLAFDRCFQTNLANCKYYASSFSCAVCNPNFFWNGTACSPSAPIVGCLEWSSFNYCSTCETGYYSTSGTCAVRGVIITNCLYYESANTCRYCALGYYPSDSTCVGVTTPVPNCQYYSGNGVCLRCIDGNYLTTNGQCIANCLQGLGNTCQTCIAYYVYNTVSGQCQPVVNPIANCRFYQTNTTCTTCDPGYYLVNGRCTFDPAISNSNCAVAYPSECIICSPGFYNPGTGNCIAVPATITGCLIYDRRGFCDLCDSLHFMVAASRICAPLPAQHDCYCYAGVTWAW